MPFAPKRRVPRPLPLSRWLLAIAALVFLMVVVGGITRLTESGLSMVRWDPVSGIVPPLTDAQWQAEFAAYRATPEYQQVNSGMALAAFKGIFFWEYLHRLIGRLIGIAFALMLGWAVWARAIPKGYGWRLVGLFALGGLQGVIGWWMVYSGLIDRPDVSHIRLAVHLVNALLIFALLIWTALDLRAPGSRSARLRLLPGVAILLLGLQITLGAFTAGLDAGFAFAEWPTMGGRFFPEGVPLLEPAWRNLVDQPIVVQFTHRWFAWIVALGVAGVALRLWRAGAATHAVAILLLVALQIVLGISTLLSGVMIPIAVAHQAGAALLLAGLVAGAHRLGRPAAR
jgi:heme a synthase